MYDLDCISLMSAPAAKAFSEPVSTTQPISMSASKVSRAEPSSLIKAAHKAFRALGRFRVIRPTCPRVSTVMFS